MELGADIIDNLALDEVGQFALALPVFPGREFAGMLAHQGVDGEGAIGGVCKVEAGIGVQGKGNIQRNVQPASQGFGTAVCVLGRKIAFGVHAGTAAEPAHPRATGHKVVPVVVFVLVLAVNGAVRSGPLQPVAGPFRPAGLAGNGRRADDTGIPGLARDIPYSAAHAYGIAAHPSFIGGFVVQNDETAAVHFETAQVYPGAAAHLLIDEQQRGASPVMNRVAGGRRAFGERGIAYIDAVFASLGDVRVPG